MRLNKPIVHSGGCELVIVVIFAFQQRKTCCPLFLADSCSYRIDIVVLFPSFVVLSDQVGSTKLTNHGASTISVIRNHCSRV